MDTGTVVAGLGVLIALFGYLEIIRRDLRQEIKEARQASETAHNGLRQEIREVRQASETAHQDIQGRLSNVETQLAAVTARVDCVDDKIDHIQRQLTEGK